jgi:hypothetical protein
MPALLIENCFNLFSALGDLLIPKRFEAFHDSDG